LARQEVAVAQPGSATPAFGHASGEMWVASDKPCVTGAYMLLHVCGREVLERGQDVGREVRRRSTIMWISNALQTDNVARSQLRHTRLAYTSNSTV
jgi:hypothetical protein